METPKKSVETIDNCFICSTTVTKKEKLYVFGKSSIDFCSLINSALGVDLKTYSAAAKARLFVCKAKCYSKLLKFKRTSENLQEIKQELEDVYSATGRTKRLREAESDDERGPKVLRFSASATLTSTRRDSCSNSSNVEGESFASTVPSLLSPVPSSVDSVNLRSSAVTTSTPKGNVSRATTVQLSVRYPSKNVNKSLQGSYQAIGKALAHGVPSRIANAALNCPAVRKQIFEKTLSILKKEVIGLCSKNNPSLLRKGSKDDLLNFDLQRVCEEWKTRAPLFYSMLMTAAINKRTKASTWFGSVAIAGSVLLKQRSLKMDATASVLGITMKTKSIEVRLARRLKFSKI